MENIYAGGSVAERRTVVVGEPAAVYEYTNACATKYERRNCKNITTPCNPCTFMQAYIVTVAMLITQYFSQIRVLKIRSHE